MSNQITTAFVETYKANVYHLTQQEGSKLRMAVDEEKVTGRNAYFEQLGLTEMVEVTSRHSDTPRVDVPHARRRLSLRDYKWSELIDDSDKIRLLIDPASPYARAAAMAAGRTIDRTIIAAADATAFTGVDGSTSTAFDTNMVVDVQERWPGVTAGDYGLNVAKLIKAGELLGNNNVDVDEEKYLVVNSRQIASLMKDSRHVSHDYNLLRPLVDGKVVKYYGFNLIPTQLIGLDANSDDKCPYWARGGMKLGIGADIQTRIGERADKNYSTQVFCALTLGATRMEETRVGYIECDPAAGPGG
jgi:hypothetical protein